MGKQIRKPRPPRPSALSTLLAVNQSSPPSKKRGKRVDANIGDLVAYHPIHGHTQGVVGEVTAIIDDDRVVVKAFAPQYEQYEGHEWVALTRKPSGQTPDGDDRSDYTIYLTKVIYRNPGLSSSPKKKTAKKPKPVTVLEGSDALVEHLKTSDPDEKVAVVYIPDAELAAEG